jgi:hypothetical protein
LYDCAFPTAVHDSDTLVPVHEAMAVSPVGADGVEPAVAVAVGVLVFVAVLVLVLVGVGVLVAVGVFVRVGVIVAVPVAVAVGVAQAPRKTWFEIGPSPRAFTPLTT